jgi:hypothetical protein
MQESNKGSISASLVVCLGNHVFVKPTVVNLNQVLWLRFAHRNRKT